MEPNESRNESVPDGLVDAVAANNHELYASRGQSDKAEKDPAATGASGAQNHHTAKQTEKQDKNNEASDEEDAGDNANGTDSQDFSHQVPSKDEDQAEETTDASSDVTSQEETTVDDTEWQKYLPARPADFELKAPEPDGLGRVDPDEYTNYLEKKVEYNADVKAYNRAVVTQAFEAAEKVLPELKTNVTLQNIVKQTYLADIRDGKTDANPVTVARELKKAFDGKVAEGVQNTQTHIEVQKNATVEKNGATKRKASTRKGDDFDRRLQRNDTSAFEDLMGQWIDDKKI